LSYKDQHSVELSFTHLLSVFIKLISITMALAVSRQNRKKLLRLRCFHHICSSRRTGFSAHGQTHSWVLGILPREYIILVCY